MKLTRHNGRAGKNGTYNPKHNDRQFDLENSEHIDAERARQNVYWDCYNGYRAFADKENENELADTFEDVEQRYYDHHYDSFVEGQNARNAKNRHTERNRTTDEIRKNKKTCPEETVYQIGTMEEHASPEVLLQIVTEFISEIDKRFGSHVHTLDWALHLDESSPHIHERHVFDCENQYGELCPQQEKALEALGFELPEPDKKAGRYNNRKMVFDSACRVLLFEIAKKHGLHLEEEPEYGGRKYLEKQDFILAKQKERIAEREQEIQQQGEQIKGQVTTLVKQDSIIRRNADEIAGQEEKLSELTMKIEDVEALIEDVSQVAYDKAVEVVTNTVRAETQKEDVKIISDYRDWILKPERKAPKEKREYAAKVLDIVKDKIQAAAQKLITAVTQTLMKPEVREAGVEAVKDTARESIHDLLARNKIKADQENQARWERQGRPQRTARKNDMEH